MEEIDDDPAKLLMEDENQLFEVDEAKGESAMIDQPPDLTGSP